MAGRITVKALSGEVELLWKRVHELESSMPYRIEQAIQDAARKGATRQQLIAEQAYLIAERRGFAGGSPEQDWLDAEREIGRLLGMRGKNLSYRCPLDEPCHADVLLARANAKLDTVLSWE